MSAYICNPEHFAALAVYACKRLAVIPEWQPMPSFIAAELAMETGAAIAKARGL